MACPSKGVDRVCNYEGAQSEACLRSIGRQRRRAEAMHSPHHKLGPPGARMVRSAATEVARAATTAERVKREENMAKDWQKGETGKRTKQGSDSKKSRLWTSGIVVLVCHRARRLPCLARPNKSGRMTAEARASDRPTTGGLGLLFILDDVRPWGVVVEHGKGVFKQQSLLGCALRPARPPPRGSERTNGRVTCFWGLAISALVGHVILIRA